MVIFKCKICGGSLEIDGAQSVAVCEYCGTKQTVPRLDDERRANLYDRANHFRRNNDFDKAMGIYEGILGEDNTDAEAYWSILLCRYGIEYVEDPATHKRIPTVNRAQFTSIFDDEDYKSAIQNADEGQRALYEAEAETINEIQKGFLAISQREEPFDVFICYKETDARGRRTPDSVLATELYNELTREGFKVFFSRITLEDKLGVAYEPYIFAALHSAKVMVALGTRPEYFNAVWVKNEWSRYLALIKNGAKKILIPAYRDMDPYDLPDEFSHLQAQDMSKLGFMQDLTRGIEKIVGVNAPKATVKETVTATVAPLNIAPLLKRVSMFFEDGDFERADKLCEQVLNQDPENAQAYLGKLMAEMHVKLKADLANCAHPFDSSKNYEKAFRFGDEKLKAELAGYIEHINTRNENARREGLYQAALALMGQAKCAADYSKAAESFAEIAEYKDADERGKECLEQAERTRKNVIYSNACGLLENHTRKDKKIDKMAHENAIKMFESLNGWKDSANKIALCHGRIEQIEKELEEERIEKERKAERRRRVAKRIKKIAMIGVPCLLALTTILSLLIFVIIPTVKYNNAISLMEEGKYTEAIAAFEALDGYKDSADKIFDCKYEGAIAQAEAGNVVEAYETLITLGGYRDSAEKASALFASYEVAKIKAAKVGDYVLFGAYEQDNDTSSGKEDIEWIVLSIEDGRALLISKYALDCRRYNVSTVSTTWETCTLRQWLNNDFLNAAFSAEEKERISTVTVSADPNPDYSTNPGNATQDQIFLLSIIEVNKHFGSNSERQCKATDYAIACGVTVDTNGYCRWWLRTPGNYSYRAACIETDGVVIKFGGSADGSDRAIRPAMWIDLSTVK